MSMFRSHKLLISVGLLAVILLPPPAFAEHGETTNSSCPEGEEPDEQETPQCCASLWMEQSATGKICIQQPTSMNVAVAVTLIMLFTFMISLQCFLNHHDTDMREMAYTGISSTVSIFTAVLTFQSMDGLVEDFVHRPLQQISGWSNTGLIVNLFQMLSCYAATQITIARVSCALKPQWWRERALAEDRDEHGRTEQMLDVEIRSVCYGLLLAHLSGFASIRFWTEVQQMQAFRESPLKSSLVLPIAMATTLCLEKLTFMCREALVAYRSRHKWDWFEETWNKKCVQAEDDMLGLTLSVLGVNTLRFAVNESHGHRCLPGLNQQEIGYECEYHHSLGEVVWLFGFGALFMVFLFFTKLFFIKIYAESVQEEFRGKRRTSKLITGGKLFEEEEELERSCLQEVGARLEDVTLATWAMAHAWCIFHSTRQYMMLINPDILGRDGKDIILQVVLAFGVTYLSWIVGRVMDLIADRAAGWNFAAVDESIRIGIQATSILVGFAWEQAFDQSIDQLSETLRDDFGPHAPALGKLLLGSGCVAVVFLSWKWYILPFVFKKGWRFGYIFSKTDLHDRVEELAMHDSDFGLDHLQDITRKLAKKNTMYRKRFSDDSYQSLPVSEIDMMRADLEDMQNYVKVLEEELEFERKVRVEAQSILKCKNRGRDFLQQPQEDDTDSRMDSHIVQKPRASPTRSGGPMFDAFRGFVRQTSLASTASFGRQTSCEFRLLDAGLGG